MSGLRYALILGALIALPATATSVRADDPGAVAYPDNPSKTPAATDDGKPVALGSKACATPGCPDKPDAPASKATSAAGPDQKPGVRTPATAYTGNPQAIPSTAPNGASPK